MVDFCVFNMWGKYIDKYAVTAMTNHMYIHSLLRQKKKVEHVSQYESDVIFMLFT